MTDAENFVKLLNAATKSLTEVHQALAGLPAAASRLTASFEQLFELIQMAVPPRQEASAAAFDDELCVHPRVGIIKSGDPEGVYAAANVCERLQCAVRATLYVHSVTGLPVIYVPDPPCTARMWHGPGHQSSTRCTVKGAHAVHEVFGTDWEWEGQTAYA